GSWMRCYEEGTVSCSTQEDQTYQEDEEDGAMADSVGDTEGIKKLMQTTREKA
ncbi:hypothetical protein Dimus_024687, partial [Dionaea muscipula]